MSQKDDRTNVLSHGILGGFCAFFTLIVTTSVSPGDTVLFDDFQDGNYTANPTWVRKNSLGASQVMADPARLNNLVLAMHGTDTAHAQISSAISTPWVGIDFQADFRVQSHSFDTFLGVGNSTDGAYVRLVDATGGRTNFVLNGFGIASALTINASPTTYWHVNLWHDLSSGLLRASIVDVATSALIGQQSVDPSVDLAAQPSLTETFLYAQETPWQYFDNVSVTNAVPLPSAGVAGSAILVLILLARLRRRATVRLSSGLSGGFDCGAEARRLAASVVGGSALLGIILTVRIAKRATVAKEKR